MIWIILNWMRQKWMQMKKHRKWIYLNWLECSHKKDLKIILIIWHKILKWTDISYLTQIVKHLIKLWIFFIKKMCFLSSIIILKISQISINLEYSKVAIITYKMLINITVLWILVQKANLIILGFLFFFLQVNKFFLILNQDL